MWQAQPGTIGDCDAFATCAVDGVSVPRGSIGAGCSIQYAEGCSLDRSAVLSCDAGWLAMLTDCGASQECVMLPANHSRCLEASFPFILAA